MEIKKTIFSSISKVQAAFTAAITDIITSAAHGLQDNDCVQLTTTATLPAGLVLATSYYVISRTEDTFKLSLSPGGTEVDITDIGTGTHTFHLKGKAIYVGSYKDHKLTMDFSGTPTMTVKVQGSDQDVVDFNAAQSAFNRWDYVQIIDTQNNIPNDGDVGIVVTAGDYPHQDYSVNVDGLVWLTVVVTAWTAGALAVEYTGWE